MVGREVWKIGEGRGEGASVEVRGIMVVVVVAGPVVVMGGEVEVGVVVEVDCMAGGEVAVVVVAAAASSLLTSGIFAEFVIVVFGSSQKLL